MRASNRSHLANIHIEISLSMNLNLASNRIFSFLGYELALIKSEETGQHVLQDVVAVMSRFIYFFVIYFSILAMNRILRLEYKLVLIKNVI